MKVVNRSEPSKLIILDDAKAYTNPKFQNPGFTVNDDMRFFNEFTFFKKPPFLADNISVMKHFNLWETPSMTVV